MAIDVLAFGAGAAANAAGNLISDRIAPHTDPTVQLLQTMVDHLNNINHALDRSSHTDIIIQLTPETTGDYVIPDHGWLHLSLLLPSMTMGGTNITTAQITFMIPGIGRLTTNLSLGWNLLDLPAFTRIWTADTNTYNCILSFRDHPLGSPL